MNDRDKRRKNQILKCEIYYLSIELNEQAYSGKSRNSKFEKMNGNFGLELNAFFCKVTRATKDRSDNEKTDKISEETK